MRYTNPRLLYFTLLVVTMYKHLTQVHSQPSDNGGGSFSSDFGLFKGLKIGVRSGCLGETSIF